MARNNRPAPRTNPSPAPASPSASAAAAQEKPNQVDVETSRCRKCGSTERTDYRGVTVQEFAGVDEEGKPYTHIVRRRTSCRGCGQSRIDRTHENRVALKK